MTDPWMQAVEFGFAEHAVEVAPFRVRYFEKGEGEEPLLMLHGAGGIEVGLAHDLLARSNRVIAIEIPGFGDDGPNEVTQDSRELAETMAAVADKIGLEKYAVAGTSMGGVAALWWAALNPDRVTRLVLECPATFRLREPDPGLGEDPEAFQRAFHAQPQRKPWANTIPVPRDLALMGRLMGPPRDPELEQALAGLEQTALILWGTKDGLFPKEQGREFLRVIPKAHLIYVYDAAHDLKGDRPEAFAEVITHFLEYGDRFVVSHDSTVINQ